MGTTYDQYCTIFLRCLKKWVLPSVVAHTFNPDTQEAEAGGSLLSLRPAWFTERVQGQSGTAKATQRNTVNKLVQNYKCFTWLYRQLDRRSHGEMVVHCYI